MQTCAPGGSYTGHTGVRVYHAVTWQTVPVKMPAGHGPVPIKVFRAFIAVNQFTCVCSTLGLSYKTCPAPPRSSCFNGLWRTMVPQDTVRTKPYLVFVGPVARWCAENLVLPWLSLLLECQGLFIVVFFLQGPFLHPCNMVWGGRNSLLKCSKS